MKQRIKNISDHFLVLFPLRNLAWYIYPQIFIWILWAWLLIVYGKTGSFLLLNHYHFNILNRPLFLLAQLSGLYPLTALFVLGYARNHTGQMLNGILIVFITWYTCITFQYNNFNDWKSPGMVISHKLIHLMINPSIQPELNFPSVHAAVISALTIFWLYAFRRFGWLAVVAIVCAALLMITRLYVGWAFLSDILAGSILGSIVSLTCVIFFYSRINIWYDSRNQWWQNMIKAIIRTAAISVILVNYPKLMF